MPAATQRRGIWARTNAEGGLKSNKPDGWVIDNGPVWWLGSDSPYLAGAARAGHSAITKATTVIVGSVTSGVWGVTQGDTPAWLSDPMRVRPDGRSGERRAVLGGSRRLPAPYMWGAWVRSALLDGMGYLIYEPAYDGTPVAGSVAVLPYGSVTPPDAWGTNARIRLGDSGAELPVSDEGAFYVPGLGLRYLLELRNPTTPLDPATGVTPGTLAYHAPEFALLAGMTDYAAGTFQGSGVPSGFLKVDSPHLSQEQADNLKAAWQAAHGGSRRSTAILNAATTYEAIAVKPVDADLSDMTKEMRVAVANAFGIPYPLLAAPTSDSLTYSTLEMNLQSLEFALRPWVRGVESTLSPLLPLGTDVEIQVNTTAAITGQAPIAGTPQLPSPPTQPTGGAEDADTDSR